MRTKNIVLIGAAFAIGFLLTKLGKRQQADITHLIEKAIYKGFAEIKNSKLAVQNSKSTNIKIFAQRMIDDHVAMNQKITEITRSKNIPTPTIDNYIDNGEPYLLNPASDEFFDEDYVDYQLTAHNDLVKLFKKIRDFGDPEIQVFFTHALEQLDHHLRMAQDLADTFHTNNIPTSPLKNTDFVEEPNYKV